MRVRKNHDRTAEVPLVFKSKRRMFATLMLVLAVPVSILSLSIFLLAKRQLVGEAVYENLVTARLVANEIDAEFFGLRLEGELSVLIHLCLCLLGSEQIVQGDQS